MLTTAIKRVFGLHQLPLGQHALIDRVMAGEVAWAAIPRGMGRALCDQLPAVALAGLTEVNSPRMFIAAAAHSPPVRERLRLAAHPFGPDAAALVCRVGRRAVTACHAPSVVIDFQAHVGRDIDPSLVKPTHRHRQAAGCNGGRAWTH